MSELLEELEAKVEDCQSIHCDDWFHDIPVTNISKIRQCIGRSNRSACLLLIISLPVAGAAAVPALELALLPARGDAGALAAEDAAAAADTAGWWAGEAGAAEAVAVAGLPPRRKTLTTPWVCSQICRKRRT